MKKLLYILIFLPLLLQFCTKDIEPVKEEQGKDTLVVNDSIVNDSIDHQDSIPVTEPVIQRKSLIFVGDTTGMLVTMFEHPDTLSGHYNVLGVQSFDLDQDGQPDVRLLSSINGSPGWGVDMGSYIESLSDSTMILGFEKTDFIYYFYQVDTNRWGISTEIFYNTYLESTNSHHSDSVYYKTQRIYPKVLKSSDSLSITGSWAHKQLIFSSTGSGGGYSQQTNDYEKHIIYYTRTIKNIKYGSWPYKSDLYVGIKYKNRLGWIKINLVDLTRMVVYEYAIQR